jgi:hypothetical protein
VTRVITLGIRGCPRVLRGAGRKNCASVFPKPDRHHGGAAVFGMGYGDDAISAEIRGEVGDGLEERFPCCETGGAKNFESHHGGTSGCVILHVAGSISSWRIVQSRFVSSMKEEFGGDNSYSTDENPASKI